MYSVQIMNTGDDFVKYIEIDRNALSSRSRLLIITAESRLLIMKTDPKVSRRGQNAPFSASPARCRAYQPASDRPQRAPCARTSAVTKT